MAARLNPYSPIRFGLGSFSRVQAWVSALSRTKIQTCQERFALVGQP